MVEQRLKYKMVTKQQRFVMNKKFSVKYFDVRFDECHFIKDIKYTEESELFITLMKSSETLPIVTIKFSSIFSFRVADEGDLLRTWDQYAPLPKGIIELENPEFLKWFHEENYGLRSDFFDIKYYMIASENEVIEVLSTEEPEIIWNE